MQDFNTAKDIEETEQDSGHPSKLSPVIDFPIPSLYCIKHSTCCYYHIVKKTVPWSVSCASELGAAVCLTASVSIKRVASVSKRTVSVNDLEIDVAAAMFCRSMLQRV